MNHRRAPGWLLLVCLIPSACRSAGSDVALGPVERLNAEPGSHARFSFPYYTALLATQGGGAIAVWMRREGRSSPIVYRRAPDGSLPFGEETHLSPETLRETISIVPTLARGPRAGELYAVWQARHPESGEKLVLFRRSRDGGAIWGAERRINSEPHSFIPALAAGRDGSVYAAWTDERSKTLEVYFNRSLDSGETWLAADRKIGAAMTPRSAAISVSIATDDESGVLVVWEERGPRGRVVRAVSSADRGETWSQPVRVDDGEDRPAPTAPSVVFVSGRAVVVWTGASTGVRVRGQVWSDVSSDGGRTWGEDVLLHEVTGGISPRAHLIAAGGKASVVFHAGLADGSWQVYYTETDDAGVWQARGDEVVRVSAGDGKFVNPRLAVDADGALFVTYGDGERRILLNRSIDGGKTWGETNQLVYEVASADGGAQARYPQIAAADGVAYVIWELWADTTGAYKTLAETRTKIRTSDLYARRVTFRR